MQTLFSELRTPLEDYLKTILLDYDKNYSPEPGEKKIILYIAIYIDHVFFSKKILIMNKQQRFKTI